MYSDTLWFIFLSACSSSDFPRGLVINPSVRTFKLSHVVLMLTVQLKCLHTCRVVPFPKSLSYQNERSAEGSCSLGSVTQRMKSLWVECASLEQAAQWVCTLLPRCAGSQQSDSSPLDPRWHIPHTRRPVSPSGLSAAASTSWSKTGRSCSGSQTSAWSVPPHTRCLWPGMSIKNKKRHIIIFIS